MIVSMILLLGLSFVISSRFSHYAYTQMHQINQEKTVQIKRQLEFTLDKMRGYGLNIYGNHNVKKWFSSNQSSIDVFVNKAMAQREINNYLSNEPFIHNIYLLNNYQKKVLDGLKGEIDYEAFGDQEILKKIKDNRSQFLEFFHHEHNGLSFLGLIVPTAPAPMEHDDFVVILLDKEIIEKYLLESNDEIGIFVEILDQQGKNILGSQEYSQLLPQLLQIQKQEKTITKLNHNDHVVYINYENIKNQDWVIYYITHPKLFQSNVQEFQKKLASYVFVVIILLGGMIFWNSKKTYQPFGKLAIQIEKKFGSKLLNPMGENEEYSIIDSGIQLLTERMEEANRAVREHRVLIKSEYFRQWILQGILSEHLKESIQSQSDLLSCKEIQLGIIRIEGYAAFLEQNDFETRRIWKFAIGNIAEEILGSDETVIEMIDFGSDHIVMLIGKKITCNDMEERLIQVKEQIKNLLKIQVAIAISEEIHYTYNLRQKYDYMYNVSTIKFIIGEERIYTEKDLEVYQKQFKDMSNESTVRDLIESIRLGKEEHIKSLVDDLIQDIQKLPYSECKYQLIYTIYSIMKPFNRFETFQNIQGIEKYLEKFGTIQEIKNWLEETLLEHIQRNNEGIHENKKDKYILEIIEYFKLHIHDPMLSVEDIAEHVSLSSAYVRQIFKDVMDITLLTYILNERIEKAKELLITTDVSVTEIGERCGFQTKSHYFTTFKKLTGMTPTQYRQSKKEK